MILLSRESVRVPRRSCGFGEGEAGMKRIFKRASAILTILAAFGALPADAKEGDAKRGAEAYRACVACHALEPGLHLTGPSLAGFWGRAAGTAEGYLRYSPGLKEAGFEWNAAALDGWLADPAAMLPGTYMVFRGIDNAAARADLIAFLRLAAAPGGGEKAVAEGLLPVAWLRATAPQPIGDAPPQARVAAIRHCGDSYFVTTEDGREKPYWEKNIRLKIDSVETGPPPGKPVILAAGMQGDRASVIFASLRELKTLIKEGC
jgi:cytochrome c